MRLFGTWTVGYQLVNLLLLYVCMLCVYNLLNRAVKGVFWLGTLGAVLFMANPVHTEAVLNLSGVGDLVPCVVALLALVAYALCVEKPGPARGVVAAALLALAVAPYRQNALLVVVVVLYELLIPERADRSYRRLIAFIAVGLAGAAVHDFYLIPSALDLPGTWAPLYLVFYPIGFLPETARNLMERPVLGWLGAAGVLFCVFLAYRKARRPAVLFGLLGAAVVQLGRDVPHIDVVRRIDLVHMVGGGQLLLANVLFVIALVALFYRMMDHPRWRTTIIGFTTFLCIVFFVLQVRANLAWREAGRWVKNFHSQAAGLNLTEAEPLAVCPDYRYYRGAPVCLSESITYDTPFSPALPYVSVVPMNADKPENTQMTLEGWRPHGAVMIVEGKRPIDVAPWPYVVSQEGSSFGTDEFPVDLQRKAEDAFVLSITPREGVSLPDLVLPATRRAGIPAPPRGVQRN